MVCLWAVTCTGDACHTCGSDVTVTIIGIFDDKPQAEECQKVHDGIESKHVHHFFTDILPFTLNIPVHVWGDRNQWAH